MASPAIDLTGLGTWTEHAACRGMNPDVFHPRRGEDTRRAKAICATCPVANECLQAALTAGKAGVQGIWGGTSEKQRRQMRSTH